MFDVAVIGGGPAGLSAALVLSRCCRSVLLCDHGRPRNYASRQLHGFLTRDGVSPKDFVQLGRREISAYGAEIRDEEVLCIEKEWPAGREDDFIYALHFATGSKITARKILLATGVQDELPNIDGVERFYGMGVYHCPYCDGWEYRGQALIAYGEEHRGVELSLNLRLWSDNVTLCTSGRELDASTLKQLSANGIEFRSEIIARLDGSEDKDPALKSAIFADGTRIPCDAFFFTAGQHQQANFARDLGCKRVESGQVCTDEWFCSDVHGCFIAGDLGGREGADVQFVIQAAANGATAAVGINKQLMEEDRKSREANAPPQREI